MNSILEKLAYVVEVGKIDRNTPYPPELAGQDGASELTRQAIEQNIAIQTILNEGLIPGMKRIGEKFSRGEAYIPNMLIAARAMNAAMEHIKPFFNADTIKTRGTLVLGTVAGDLHDIGKNLVRMVMSGSGWQVIDLGTDVSSNSFLNAVKEHPGCMVGLSALLTTTMLHMEDVVKVVKKHNPQTQVFIGGAPVSKSFSEKIGADGFFTDPYALVTHLE